MDFKKLLIIITYRTKIAITCGLIVKKKNLGNILTKIKKEVKKEN